MIINEFIKNNEKKIIISVIALTFFISILFITIRHYHIPIMESIRSLPDMYNNMISYFRNISTNNFIAIYFMFAFTSTFIIPLPYDLVFIGFLKKTESPISLLLATYLGLLTGQHVNFFLGRLFGKRLMTKVKKKSREWIESYLYKYEAYALFVFNFLPLPYPLFNLIVGFTKFKYSRWVLITGTSLFIRMSLVALIFH